MEYFIELLLSGMVRGSIYALIALGYTMVYGIIQLINFAHGEVYMIGAFTALIVASILTILGWNEIAILFIASIVAVVYSMAYGYTLEKVAYKPLRHAPRLSALISAIGMSLFLQNYVLLAQTSDFMPFPSLIPDLDILEPIATMISTPEVIIILTTSIVMVLLTFLIKFTRVGNTITIDVVRMIMTSGVLIVSGDRFRWCRPGMRLGNGIKSEVWASTRSFEFPTEYGQDIGEIESGKRTDHVNFTVGKIDALDNAVHHGVPQGNQGVNAAPDHTA